MQVLEEQQRIQAGVDQEDDGQDGDHDEEQKDEELDYDGIEGMEQQIEVEGEEEDGQAPMIDG